MNAANPTTDPVSRLFHRWGWPWVHTAALALLCIGFALPPIISTIQHGNAAKDYRLWYAVGLQVCNGEPLYPTDSNGEFPFIYPPTLAVFVFAPLSCAEPGRVRGGPDRRHGWMLVCIAPALGQAGGGAYQLPSSGLRYGGRATVPYVWDMFLLGQVNLLLLTLTLGSLAALRAGWSWSAAAFWGWPSRSRGFRSRSWSISPRAALVAVLATLGATAAVLLLLPAPIRGFERNLAEVRVWAAGMLGDQSGNTLAQRNEIGFTRRNQSLEAVAHRLLRPLPAGDPHKAPVYVNLASVSPATARAVGIGGCLLLGCVLLIVTRRRFAPTAGAEGLEVGMVLVLTVLCSPLSWTYFFCWLMPGWAAAGRLSGFFSRASRSSPFGRFRACRRTGGAGRHGTLDAAAPGLWRDRLVGCGALPYAGGDPASGGVPEAEPVVVSFRAVVESGQTSPPVDRHLVHEIQQSAEPWDGKIAREVIPATSRRDSP